MNGGLMGALSLDWRIYVGLAVALIMFGLWFDAQVEKLGEQDELFVAFEVVAGVLVILVAIAVIFWEAALIGLIAFALAGLPMVIGAARRSHRIRMEAIKRAQERVFKK